MVDPHIPAGAKPYWLPPDRAKKASRTPIRTPIYTKGAPRMPRKMCDWISASQKWFCGAVFWKLYIQIWDSVRNDRVLFFALTTPTKQVQWALFCFLEPVQKIFWKSVGISQKIRQRESEKAIRLPGTLKISYTFIRYIPWANSQMKVRQDPPAANGISGTQGGERPRNHSEISGSYGYGHDRLRV